MEFIFKIFHREVILFYLFLIFGRLYAIRIFDISKFSMASSILNYPSITALHFSWSVFYIIISTISLLSLHLIFFFLVAFNCFENSLKIENSLYGKKTNIFAGIYSICFRIFVWNLFLLLFLFYITFFPNNVCRMLQKIVQVWKMC